MYMKMVLRALFLVAALLLATTCQKEEAITVQPKDSKTEQIAFRSFDLTELQAIHDALLQRINQLLSEGVFTNSNANGLIPQLRNLQRFIDRGKVEEANRILEEDIIPHLAGLNEDGILDDGVYLELDNTAHGMLDEGVVSDPNNKAYTWKKMADGKKWLTVNLDYWDGEDGQAGHYDQTPPIGDHWPYDGTTSEPYPGYGMLYTYDAALTACEKALGPGWRTPTKVDWDNLILQYDPYWDMGDISFSSSASYEDLTLGGSSGFNAPLGGGFRDPGGIFYFLKLNGYCWSGTEKSTQYAWYYLFHSTSGKVHRDAPPKSFGFSCRCLQD
jgi:uncharacterized protein (TIGR02145 family)